MSFLGLNNAPGLRKHLFLVRIRQRLKRLLVRHPLHRIMLSPHLRISLISLKQEEMDSLIVSFRTEPELILDRAKLPMQLHPTPTRLPPHFPHSRRNLILPRLNQPLGQAPNSSLVTGERQKKWLIAIPAIDNPTSGCNPDPLSGLHSAPVHEYNLGEGL